MWSCAIWEGGCYVDKLQVIMRHLGRWLLCGQVTCDPAPSGKVAALWTSYMWSCAIGEGGCSVDELPVILRHLRIVAALWTSYMWSCAIWGKWLLCGRVTCDPAPYGKVAALWTSYMWSCAIWEGGCSVDKLHVILRHLGRWLPSLKHVITSRIFRKIAKSECLLFRICLSSRPHGTTRLPVKRFSLNLVFEYFSKINRDTSSNIKNLTKITGTLHEDQ
jgi:hypothetical protein